MPLPINAHICTVHLFWSSLCFLFWIIISENTPPGFVVLVKLYIYLCVSFPEFPYFYDYLVLFDFSHFSFTHVRMFDHNLKTSEKHISNENATSWTVTFSSAGCVTGMLQYEHKQKIISELSLNILLIPFHCVCCHHQKKLGKLSALQFPFCRGSGCVSQNCFTLTNAGGIRTGGINLSFWYKNSRNLSLTAYFLCVLIVRIKLTGECCTVLQSQLHFGVQAYSTALEERNFSLQCWQFSLYFINHKFLKRGYVIWISRKDTLNFFKFISEYKACMNFTFSLQPFKYPVFSTCPGHVL